MELNDYCALIIVIVQMIVAIYFMQDRGMKRILNNTIMTPLQIIIGFLIFCGIVYLSQNGVPQFIAGTYKANIHQVILWGLNILFIWLNLSTLWMIHSIRNYGD